MLDTLRHVLAEFIQNYLLLLLFVLIVAGWFLVKRSPEWLRSIRGSQWPITTGTIETANVTPFGGQALGELGYSYWVDGTRYAGYRTRQFADEQAAWDYVDSLKGKSVAVRYKPGAFEISTLRNQDQPPGCDLNRGSFVTGLWSLLKDRKGMKS